MRIKKKLALLLSAAMLVTSVNVTPMSVQAATTGNGNAEAPATASTKLSLHIHGDWTYEASGATLTAKCFDYANCNKSVALTLTASSANYSGSSVTANYGSGEAAAWETAVGSDAPTITYEKKGTDSTWSAIDSDPVSTGEYRAVAKVTKDSTDYIAYKEFTISKAEINTVTYTEPTVAATGTPATATGLAIASTANYTGEISWSPADTSFGYNKAYTATVTLSAKDNYKFADGVTFPTGWTKDASSTETSLVLTKTYDATAKAKITSVTAPSVTTELEAFTTESAQIAALPTSVTVAVEDNSKTSMAITWALKDGATYSTASEADNTFVWTVTATEYANYDTNSKTLTGEVTLNNPVHQHTWNFTADEAVITATCTGSGDCTVENGKTTGVTLTLSASDANYSGSAYTGASLGDATAWESAIATAPTIVYVGRDGTTYAESETAPSAVGKYTAKITVDTDKTATANFEITKATQTAPTTGEGYTIDYTAETITAGTDYEVSTSNTTLTPPAGGKVTPGTTYYVRKKGNDNNAPSAWTAISVPARPAAPTGLEGVMTTGAGNSDGKITGVLDTMEYSADNGSTWTSVADKGTEITGLSAGKYKIRVKATDAAFASASVEVTVSNPHTHTYGTEGAARYTCTVCSYENATKKAQIELEEAKTAAKKAIDDEAGTEPSEKIKKVAEEAKTEIEAATTIEAVTTAKEAGIKAIRAIKAEGTYEAVEPSEGEIKDITGTKEAPAESNTYSAAIKNSDKLESLINVTPEEKTQGVNVWLEIVDASATMPAKDKTAIEKAAGDNTVGMLLDATLFKKVGDSEAEAVHDLNGKIKISIVVPENLRKEGRTYEIIRVHNGVATVIEGVYDEASYTFTFETDQFSSYALTYADVDAGNPGEDNPNNPSTGYANDVWRMVLIMILSLGVIGITMLTGKKKEA